MSIQDIYNSPLQAAFFPCLLLRLGSLALSSIWIFADQCQAYDLGTNIGVFDSLSVCKIPLLCARLFLFPRTCQFSTGVILAGQSFRFPSTSQFFPEFYGRERSTHCIHTNGDSRMSSVKYNNPIFSSVSNFFSIPGWRC